MVIIFANQKGGCGKTTLATAFSFYLSWKGYKITVFDTDEQQSLYQMYQLDKSHFENDFFFDVNYIDLADYMSVNEIFNTYQNDVNNIAVIDSSGVLDYKNLELASRADVIVVPFSFDQKSLASTLTWLKSYKHFNFDTNKIIVLANRIKSIIKKDVLNKAKELIRNDGILVCDNDIPDINSINMLTTVQMDKTTASRMQGAFDEVYNNIFNK